MGLYFIALLHSSKAGKFDFGETDPGNIPQNTPSKHTPKQAHPRCKHPTTNFGHHISKCIYSADDWGHGDDLIHIDPYNDHNPVEK